MFQFKIENTDKFIINCFELEDDKDKMEGLHLR